MGWGRRDPDRSEERAASSISSWRMTAADLGGMGGGMEDGGEEEDEGVVEEEEEAETEREGGRR